jgi:hypothetical protein
MVTLDDVLQTHWMFPYTKVLEFTVTVTQQVFGVPVNGGTTTGIVPVEPPGIEIEPVIVGPQFEIV